MKTKVEDLYFLTLEDAQRLLDQNDPGYEVAATRTGYVVIVDTDRNIVQKFACSTYATK